MSLVAFFVLNAAALAAALLAAMRVVGRGEPARLTFYTLCGALIVIHSTILAAGLVGRLATAWVAAALGLVLVGVVWWARGSVHASSEEWERPHLTSAALAAPVLALVTAGVWAWPHATEATRLWIWDDYTYHMVYPALWLRDRTIAAVLPENAFTMQAWYPLSASVVSTWFMLPFPGSRGDALAWVSLTGVLYAALVACSAAELLGRLGCRTGAWAIPVVLLATSHRIDVMASSFSDADLAQAAVLFAAFVLAVPRNAERPAEIRADAWYAALLAGLAIGIKVSAAPAVLVVLVMMAWRASTPGIRMRASGRIALIFAAGWLATGAYWYARNVLHTGNPLYPAAFLFWPGATFPNTTLREYAAHYGFARTVTDALAVYLSWPRFHAVLAILGLGGVAALLAFRYRALSRPQRFFAGGALTITAVTLLLLPSMPYSAGNAMTFISGFVHWDSMRYIALVPILGWAALGALVNAGAGAPHARTLLAIAITLGALVTSQRTWLGVALIMAVAVVLVLGLLRVGVPSLSRRAAFATAAVVSVVIAVGVAILHDVKAAATAGVVYREPLYGAAAAVLDRQPAGTRIAAFGDQWTYPAFGARHHLVPVRVDGNGRVATEPIGDGMKPGPLTVDPYTFRRNLATAYIGIVVVVQMPHPGRSPEWPEQAAALENMRGTRLLYRDRAIGIWKLGD